MFRLVTIIAAILALALPASAEKRAFIVGVGDYEQLTDLKKTIGDARGYKQTFEELGYTVTLLDENPGLIEFKIAFGSFLDTISPGDDVVFIFSGHGWSDGAENYLAPADAPRAGSTSAIRATTVALRSDVLGEIRARKPNLSLAIIDACRENPFDTLTKSGYGKGLARTSANEGELILFSAGAGQLSLDRLSDNDPAPYSVFTRVLLPKLKDTGRPLATIADETREEVQRLARTIDHPQRPEMMLGVSLGFCLTGECRTASAPTPGPTPESLAWASALKLNTAAGFEAYIIFHPSGPNVAEARRRIAAFERAEETTPATVTSDVTERDRKRQDALIAAGIEPAREQASTATSRATFTKGATVEWERTYGGVGNERANAITALPDGGMLVAGDTYSSVAVGQDMSLVRVDSDGQEVWSRTFGGAEYDSARAITALPDGGALVTGSTRSSGAGRLDMYLVRVDGDGRELWTRTYGGVEPDEARAIAALPDGGALVAGSTSSSGAGKRDMYLVRVDAVGRELWSRTYGGADDDVATAIALLSDGGALMAGFSFSAGSGGQDILLVRVDGEGRELWLRTYGGVGNDGAAAIAALPGGGALVAGSTGSSGAGGMDMYLVRVSADGRELWSRTYGGAQREEAKTVTTLPDGGALVAGITESSGAGGEDMMLVRVAADGRELWSSTYGGSMEDRANAIFALPDGGVLLAGSTWSSGAGEQDMYVLKLSPVD